MKARSFFTVLGMIILALAVVGCGGGNASLDSSGGQTVAVLEESKPLHIEKSTNGADADEGPGPSVTVNEPIEWSYMVMNASSTAVTDIDVVDNMEGAVTCPSTELGPGEDMTCTVSGTAAVGQYVNVATMTAMSDEGEALTDSDTSHYLGVNLVGTVFEDGNANGTLEAGEKGISGVTVVLDGTHTTTTDAEGKYSFAVATAGTHEVVEFDPSGYLSSTENTVTAEVALDAPTTVNFGDVPLPTDNVRGTVFEDQNMNGIMNTGEIGIPGVTITLDGSGTALTDADGRYAFSVSPTGLHTVEETDPLGYASTTANSGTVFITMGDLMSGTIFTVNFGDIAIVQVAFDIKPGSCPNPVNLRSNGVLPVAVLGTEDLDVSTIDPSSLSLQGVYPLRWSYEDVATPYDGDLDGCISCSEDGPDGYTDLTLKFATQEIKNVLGDVVRGDHVVLELTGALMDGVPLAGEDMLVIVQTEKVK